MTGERRLRCPSQFFAVAIEATGYLRIRCHGKLCKAPSNHITLHIFDLATGVLVRTEHPAYRHPSELLGAVTKESA